MQWTIRHDDFELGFDDYDAAEVDGIDLFEFSEALAIGIERWLETV